VDGRKLPPSRCLTKIFGHKKEALPSKSLFILTTY
jgi:hypothetical protein